MINGVRSRGVGLVHLRFNAEHSALSDDVTIYELSFIRTFRSRARAHPRRCELTGARVSQRGGEPFFVARAKGAKIWDVDGNEYIDYVGSWGPAILGHAPKVVVDAVREAATRGLSFGIPNPLEVEMAELICEWMPSIEKVRMVNSGTEATMSCIRLARAFTGRDKIIKFDGCYHGHVDALLVKTGSGALTHGQPDSAGVPQAFADLTISLAVQRCRSCAESVSLRTKGRSRP